MERLIPAIILCADTFQDIRKKEIFFVLTVFSAVTGIVIEAASAETGAAAIMISLAPGMLFLAISALSRGQTGAGDSLVLFMTGAWTGLYIWRILLLGLFSAAAYAAVIWVVRRRNMEFPFVPFLLAGFAADTVLIRIAG